MAFVNVYEDTLRAESYAKLYFPGTYYLAYRDLPEIIKEHVAGNRAVDVGCGTGRSTRVLKELGFTVIGIDIAADMINKAREFDPDGDYRLAEDGEFAGIQERMHDLVTAIFTFDNIPTMEKKVSLLAGMRNLLNGNGRIINLVSDPNIYTHEWASFTTKDFPENAAAKAGDIVKIVMTDVDDARPVEDVLWPHDAYQEIFRQAGLRVDKIYRPLAHEHEPFEWVNETRISPWVIYVLKKEK